MRTSLAGQALIKKREQLHDGDLKTPGLQPKLCPAGYWTVGWGHVVYYKGRPLKGTVDKSIALSLYPNMSIEQADELFTEDLTVFENNINDLKLTLNQNQFDALVSFTYNLGEGALLSSTLLKLIRKGEKSPELITAAFKAWNKMRDPKTKVLEVNEGLTIRRLAEAKLFLS